MRSSSSELEIQAMRLLVVLCDMTDGRVDVDVEQLGLFERAQSLGVMEMTGEEFGVYRDGVHARVRRRRRG